MISMSRNMALQKIWRAFADPQNTSTDVLSQIGQKLRDERDLLEQVGFGGQVQFFETRSGDRAPMVCGAELTTGNDILAAPSTPLPPNAEPGLAMDLVEVYRLADDYVAALTQARGNQQQMDAPRMQR